MAINILMTPTMGAREKTHRSRGSVVARRKIGTAHGAQAAAARKLRMEPDQLSRILAEKQSCSLAYAVRFQKVYGIPPKWWLEPASAKAAA